VTKEKLCELKISSFERSKKSSGASDLMEIIIWPLLMDYLLKHKYLKKKNY
jgi:hypothetical protein